MNAKTNNAITSHNIGDNSKQQPLVYSPTKPISETSFL